MSTGGVDGSILSNDELIALLRKQASAWFSNPNILLLEELFRRLKAAEKRNTLLKESQEQQS